MIRSVTIASIVLCSVSLIACGSSSGGGNNNNNQGGGSNAPANLSVGDVIVFTDVAGAGGPCGQLTVTITAGMMLDYNYPPDTGTANWTWNVNGNTTTFFTGFTSNQGMGSGTNTWTMNWTSSTGGTATDPNPCMMTFTYTPAAGGGGVMPPAGLAAGNVLVFNHNGGFMETWTFTSSTLFDYMDNQPINGGGSVQSLTPSGTMWAMMVSVPGFTGAYDLTWTSNTAGTFVGGGGAGNFTFTP